MNSNKIQLNTNNCETPAEFYDWAEAQLVARGYEVERVCAVCVDEESNELVNRLWVEYCNR